MKVPAVVCVEELKEKKTGSCPLCALRRCKDSRAAGADGVVGIVVGGAPLGQPGTLPLSNGRIPWYRVRLSAQRFEKLLQNKDIIEKYHVNRNNPNQKGSQSRSSADTF